jgi:hypothetical protein
MAAAKITSTSNMVAYPWKLATLTKVTQSDWTILDCAGTLHFGTRLVTGALETPTYPKLDADEAVDGFTAAETAIAYDGATANTRPAGGYYVLVGTTGEILYVYTDSGYNAASGTLTVRRGALGTTAAAIANNAALYVLCTIILGSATVGPASITYLPLPDDPGTQIVG